VVFDELYDVLFVRPVHVVSRWCAVFDRRWVDGFIDGTARWTARFAAFWERLTDRIVMTAWWTGLPAGRIEWVFRCAASRREPAPICVVPGRGSHCGVPD